MNPSVVVVKPTSVCHLTTKKRSKKWAAPQQCKLCVRNYREGLRANSSGRLLPSVKIDVWRCQHNKQLTPGSTPTGCCWGEVATGKELSFRKKEMAPGDCEWVRDFPLVGCVSTRHDIKRLRLVLNIKAFHKFYIIQESRKPINNFVWIIKGKSGSIVIF